MGNGHTVVVGYRASCYSLMCQYHVLRVPLLHFIVLQDWKFSVQDVTLFNRRQFLTDFHYQRFGVLGLQSINFEDIKAAFHLYSNQPTKI